MARWKPSYRHLQLQSITRPFSEHGISFRVPQRCQSPCMGAENLDGHQNFETKFIHIHHQRMTVRIRLRARNLLSMVRNFVNKGIVPSSLSARTSAQTDECAKVSIHTGLSSLLSIMRQKKKGNRHWQKGKGQRKSWVCVADANPAHVRCALNKTRRPLLREKVRGVGRIVDWRRAEELGAEEN